MATVDPKIREFVLKSPIGKQLARAGLVPPLPAPPCFSPAP